MKNKKLKSLDDHNIEHYRFWYQADSDSPIPNGIECPKCKSELLDSEPMLTLTTHPPQKRIHCTKCDYVGYRLT